MIAVEAKIKRSEGGFSTIWNLYEVSDDCQLDLPGESTAVRGAEGRISVRVGMSTKSPTISS